MRVSDGGLLIVAPRTRPVAGSKSARAAIVIHPVERREFHGVEMPPRAEATNDFQSGSHVAGLKRDSRSAP
jgi:hypothetical protein